MIRKNVSVVFRSIIICILLIVPALLTSVYAATVRSAGGVPVINPEHITGEDLVAAARKYIGSPYTYHDTWPNRTGFGQTRMFDCSGLVCRATRDVGLTSTRPNYSVETPQKDSYGNYYLTAHSLEQKQYGIDISAEVYKVKNNCDVSGLLAGDILFFDLDNNGTTDHVAIYSGNGNMIHACGIGVIETSITADHESSNSYRLWLYSAVRLIDPCIHKNVKIGICQDWGAVIEDKVGYTVTQNCDQQMIPVNDQTTIRTTPYNSTAANAKSNGISLSKGEISYFHIIAKGRNSLGHEWYKLDYYEKTTGEQVSGIRYVYVDRVKAKPAPAPQPTAAGTVRQWGVNLRTGGSPYDSRILTIPAYAPVTVLPAKTAGSGWLNVRYNGSTGYASGEYINLTDADNSSGLKVAQGSITFKRGTVPQLTGKITSGKTITYVRAVMDELECFGFVNPGTSAVPLNQLQFIGNGLSGATSGRHTLVLTAMDAAGSVVNQTISVDVTEGEVVQAPTICISDAVEGKQITILNNTAGATVYYFLNDSPAGEKVYSAPLTVTESATIYAYAEKTESAAQRKVRRFP